MAAGKEEEAGDNVGAGDGVVSGGDVEKGGGGGTDAGKGFHGNDGFVVEGVLSAPAEVECAVGAPRSQDEEVVVAAAAAADADAGATSRSALGSGTVPGTVLGAVPIAHALAGFSTARTAVSVGFDESGPLDVSESGRGLRTAGSGRSISNSARLPRNAEV